MKKICFLLFGAVSIQQVYAFDLAYTYQQALTYNADYLKQIASTSSTQEQKNIARAQLLPQISGSASMNENYFDQGGMSAFYHQPVYQAQFQQVIFDWSKYSGFSKGKYAAEVGNLQLKNAEQQLMVTVSQAYFDVLYAEDTLRATQMTKEALEQQMNQAKKSFEVGTVTIADVNDAQAAFDAAGAQEIQNTNDLIYKKNIFRNLTGLDPDQIQPLADNTNLVLPTPSNVNTWAKMGESGNFNIKIAEKQVEMANQDIHIAVSGHLPTVNLVANFQYQDTGGIDSSNMSESTVNSFANIPGTPLSSYGVGAAGVQLNVPIYSGGGVSAQVRQARANYEASQQQLVSTERQTDQNIRNTYWQVQNGVSIVKAQQTALKSAKTKLDSDKLGYQVGVRNSVDLVSSQKNYYQTFQTYQQSRYQYIMARIQLRYLSGSIDDKFIKQINTDIKTQR